MPSSAQSTASARRAMIDSQLRPSGISQAWVLAAFARVPREDHLPAAARASAYSDRAIALGAGAALPAPLVQARLLAEAAPTLHDHALLVSCGSGYLAALLEPLVGTLTVVTPEQAVTATPLGENFTLLLIEGAIEALPAALTASLADGARIVTGLVERGVTRFATGRKLAGAVQLLARAEIGMPVLAQFAAPRRWSF